MKYIFLRCVPALYVLLDDQTLNEVSDFLGSTAGKILSH